MNFTAGYSRLKHARRKIISLKELKPFRYFCKISPYDLTAEMYAQEAADYEAFSNECLDIINSIRTSLDISYYSIVSKFVPANKQKRIYFPISASESEWEKRCRDCFADQVSQDFFETILGLESFLQPGKPSFIYHLNLLSNHYKHKDNFPINYTIKLNAYDIYKQVPEVIRHMTPNSNVILTGNEKDLILGIDLRKISQDIWDADRSGSYVRELNFQLGAKYCLHTDGYIVDDLNDFVLAAENVLQRIERFT